MKLEILILFTLLIAVGRPGFSQTKLNFGGGYYGDKISHPGLVLELEREKFFSDRFSLPLRADLGYFIAPDYNIFFIDLHKGFRKYFDSGLFLEQSIGVGMVATFYTLESIWYIDDYSNIVRYKEGANWGFSPSASFGIGYQFGSEGQKRNAVWLRPKVYWNFGIRGLHQPYSALQIGYSYNFKTKPL